MKKFKVGDIVLWKRPLSRSLNSLEAAHRYDIYQIIDINRLLGYYVVEDVVTRFTAQIYIDYEFRLAGCSLTHVDLSELDRLVLGL